MLAEIDEKIDRKFLQGTVTRLWAKHIQVVQTNAVGIVRKLERGSWRQGPFKAVSAFKPREKALDWP